MVGFGSLWTFSSGLYCFFFTLHFSVPEILLYIKTPVYCRLHTNFALITVQKVFFPPAVFSLFLHVYAIFAMFLGVFSQLFLFTRPCNSAVWNDFPQYGKRNALQVPASGTKIVLNILSYFCQPLQWYPILKICYTNYDIIVHRAARLPHGTQTAVRTALPKRRRLFYGKKCDRRSIRRPHFSHQFQPGRRL